MPIPKNYKLKGTFLSEKGNKKGTSVIKKGNKTGTFIF